MRYVDETRCAGCGACLQVCPSNAIRLVDDVARIDAALCNDCRACVAVCPSDAIVDALPVPAAQTVPVIETKGVPTRSRAVAPALGAALAFVGREVAPRVASAVVDTLLERAAERTRAPLTSAAPSQHARRLRRRTRGTSR